MLVGNITGILQILKRPYASKTFDTNAHDSVFDAVKGKLCVASFNLSVVCDILRLHVWWS